MNKKKFIDVYYSTDSKLERIEEEIKQTDYLQKVFISLNRAKNSKYVTLISNINSSEDELVNISKILKSKCGTGGTVKNGEILIQGDFVEKIYNIIKDMGFTNIKK